MTNLSGYHLGEILYEGTRTLVQRGTRTTDSQPVVIKFLRNEYPSFNELLQFRNQYTIAKNLDLPGIVKPLALETHGNGYALVMPDDGYISLGKWQKEEFPMVDFLTIAIQLVGILHGLYRNRVIHKDIKPANILIHPQTKQVKIIDFSISSLLPKETLQISNPNVLEGTLAYISPEQTGRMNRGIDYRTDFYSLGVTFYELLTGELPFQSDDPIELVHCHIAKSPMALGNGERGTGNGKWIPQVLSDVVMKLMAKNAEDRYQSALGLKHDLEKCLCQWKETGKIELFELAERDICDRFIIPEKLYGRQGEVQALLTAFERVANGATEMMLVAGFSGIGKTAVVNEVHKPIVRQRGYFIKGKFDQFNRNIPFSAFVSAFRTLMGQLLGESDANLASWKSQILEAVGDNGQVIIDVIPELENIIGQQPPVPELSGGVAQNRFNLLFGKFVRVFATSEHPLVVFLDDLQWADSASLNLLKLLMNESESGYLLVLGAYRDNEVFGAHPLMLTLDDIQKQGATIDTLTLAALEKVDITRLVADTLLCSTEIATPLSQLVYQKTQGNPFFTTQFLVGLHEDDPITFEVNAGYWQCDLAQVRQLALTSDVVEFMVGRLRKLPEGTQNVLKLAACIGNQFDLGTLALVCEDSQEGVAADLWCALQERFVIPESETYKFFQGDECQEKGVEDVAVGYRFLHDRVQQAAYSLIAEEQKQATHLKIGTRLYNNLQTQSLEEKIFDIVNQFNTGRELIIAQSERNLLAKLNLMAGRKAKKSTAYITANDYLSIGLNLQDSHPWKQYYDFTLDLYLEAVEVAYLSGDFPQMEQLAATVLAQVKTPIEALKIYEVKILAYEAQNRALEAIEMTLPFLQKLGVEFPPKPSQTDIVQGLESVQKHVLEKNIEELIKLPLMSDPIQLAAIHTIMSLSTASYLAFPELIPLIISKAVHLSIQYGNAVDSPFAYSGYALILCGVVGDIDAGYQFGQLALALLSKFDNKSIEVKTLQTVNVFVTHWRSHLHNTLSALRQAYQVGLEVGELNFACLSAFSYGHNSYFLGMELRQLVEEMADYSHVMESLKQNQTVQQNDIFRQSVMNLLGEGEEPSYLSGEAYNEKIMIPLHEKANETSTLGFFHLNKLILFYLFEEWSLSVESGLQVRRYLEGMMGRFVVPVFHFYNALALLKCCSLESDGEPKKMWEEINDHQTKIDRWSQYAPMNFLHKSHLIEAEKQRVLGQNIAALEWYDRAIAGAKENEYLQEEALANELAAKFYLDWGKEKIAQTYMVEAYYCYARWGAKAKTDQLEATYPQLLAPILQQPKSSLTLNVTQTLTSHQTVCTSTSSNADTSLLDISAAIKAAQALSGEIELEALLSQLMQIVLENAGADKGAFVSNDTVTCEVYAQCGKESYQLSYTPLDDAETLPTSIIRAVGRIQETVILNQVENDTRFAGDNYLIQQQPKSLFCTPILNQGQLIGILYLENNLSADAFTQERVEILNLLCSQAAISIENARLYENAQAANKMLQKSLEDLKQAQLQMVQSEKMSALGNLVAGVAHEINNPVGFIGGNLQPARDYIQDLFGLIDLYREKYPDGDEEIEEETEAIDLDFLREDLPKLMGSMKLGVERIAHISTSLRTFSRTDQEHKVPFNIHDGLDSTLLILKHRLKANEQRPKIGIIKHYGKIPEIRCFPGQLNQVFMNLIANAIDALEDTNEGRSFEEIAAHPNRITIQTQIHKEQVIIQIADNGVGIPENVKARIFEQGFTTKGVGKGTGLGMAIARQIIQEKHCGTISCSSELGKGTEFAIALSILG